jgi:hypothetical protein
MWKEREKNFIKSVIRSTQRLPFSLWERRLTYFDQLFKMKDPSLTACSPNPAFTAS